ncbi:hypothetical protein YC2023_002158 [Brassica napus]
MVRVNNNRFTPVSPAFRYQYNNKRKGYWRQRGVNAGEQPHRSVREPFTSCWVGLGWVGFRSLGSFSQHLNCHHVDKPLEKNIQEQTDIVPTTNRLEGPPGFPPLFPELPPEDRAMAMQYISHSNETERRARILRVQQSIELEKSNPPAVLTKISHNLEKEKGHVFGYGVSESASGETRMVAHAVTAPAGERIHSSSEVQLSGESISPAPAPKRPAEPQGLLKPGHRGVGEMEGTGLQLG